jgi:excisionase family DNA binding protein
MTVEWLEIGEAAKILGVHFTTLRRWADAGKIPYTRSVSGRRRFNRSVMEQIASSDELKEQPLDLAPIETQTLDQTRRNAHDLLSHSGQWASTMNNEQRIAFRYSGQRLLGLLLQVTSHENSEPYIAEGKRLAQDYGDLCYRAGMSIIQLVETFLGFRRNILESIYATNRLANPRDSESQVLFERANDFFDMFLLCMLDRYVSLQELPEVRS